MFAAQFLIVLCKKLEKNKLDFILYYTELNIYNVNIFSLSIYLKKFSFFALLSI